MGEQNVIRLRGVTIYHTDDPFGSRSEKKLLQQGELILSDLNFDINAGEFVYLIGTTGSGKTTLLRLITREIVPTRGQISVGNQNLRKIRASELPYYRRSIGVVFQEPMLFARSIRENLLVGKPDATDAEMMQALELAQAAEVMARQADGLDTLVGERGRTLSGGERQRFSIARALLKKPAAAG